MLFTEGKTQCKPRDVGYDPERLDVLNNHFQKLIDEGKIQCAIYCLSRKGKIFAHGAIGKKTYRKNDNTPVKPDSVRYIASVTKLFAAVAIMKLVEDGLTRLDATVGEILPQFNTPPYDKITLFHLLTHTSGMYPDPGCFENKYQSNYWSMIENAYKLHKPKKDGEFDWITAALGTIGTGLRTNPDTEWAYCSFGFVILGAVIEKLTGIHANKYIEDYISLPLGMKDTVFDLTPDMAKRAIVTDKETEKYINSIIDGTYKPRWVGEKLNLPGTGGGLNGTAYDMNIFGNMVLNGGTLNNTRIIGRKAIEKMTTHQLHNIPDYTWGGNTQNRGFGVGFDMRDGPAFTFSPNSYCHEGAGSCALYIDPQEELVAVWIVPFLGEGWHITAIFNVVNIIWSGLI